VEVLDFQDNVADLSGHHHLRSDIAGIKGRLRSP
jgi:hypothetical protein